MIHASPKPVGAPDPITFENRALVETASDGLERSMLKKAFIFVNARRFKLPLVCPHPPPHRRDTDAGTDVIPTFRFIITRRI